MSDFSAEWLDLRAAADGRARSNDLTERLAGWQRGKTKLRVCDLGAGTGANLRHLAPRLGGGQHWTLIDQDQALLEIALARCRPLALDGFAARRAEMADPAWLKGADLATADLITASALLDLVSVDCLAGLMERGAAEGSAFFFVLTYDGRAEWRPRDPEDAAITAALNRHQKGDKGFGPALGPDSARPAARILEADGYRVTTAASDWRLGPEDGALQRNLAEGWAAAALELEPQRAAPVGDWLARRLAWIRAAQSHLEVGHVDLFAQP